MELHPEHISQLITKYLTGELTTKEEDLLDAWLEDPYNELQFNKIVDPNSFIKKVDQYRKYDSSKAFKNVIKKQGKPYKMWLSYAAVIVLPIGIALGLLSKSIWDAPQSNNLLADTEIASTEVLLSTQEGSYTLGKSDTTLSIGNMHLQTDKEQLSYSTGSTSVKEEKLVYNVLKTPKGVKYKVVLSDGTNVWLNSETTFRYPINFITNKREVFVEEGEAFFDVTSNKDKPFVVNFNDKKIEVLGTEFNVKAYDDEDYDLVTLVEGSIKLISEHNDIELIPNQQAIISHSNNDMQVKVVEGALYTAWKDNVYLYKDQPLNTIIRDLERDFDIRVFYQNQDLKNEKFSLKISRKLPFEAIFSAIEKTHEIDIDIKDNNVILKKK